MSRPSSIALAAALIAVFVVMAAADILSTSPTTDETAHLAAGYLYLTTGDYRLNTEHPPLLKKMAALPLLFMSVWPMRNAAQGRMSLQQLATDWNRAIDTAPAEWFFSHDLFFGIRDAAYIRSGHDPDTLPTTYPLTPADFLNDAQSMFRRARFVMLLFGAVLAALVYAWSSRLWGAAGGVASVLLFVFDPNFIAHSGLVTTDVGVAALMFASTWFLWRWSLAPTRMSAAGFIACFALAQAAKFSALLLVPIVIVCMFFLSGNRRTKLILLAGAFLAAWVAIWGAYGFRYAATATGTQRLPLDGLVQLWDARRAAAARGLPVTDDVLSSLAKQAPRSFASNSVLIASRLHALPEAYLFGFAFQQSNGAVRQSFLNGVSTKEPLHSYFLWTFLYKTPLAAMVAIAAGVFFAFRQRPRREFIFLIVPVVIHLGVSMAYALSIGHRHILPVYPFLYVLVGSIAVEIAKLPRAVRIAVSAAGAALVVCGGLFVFLPPALTWGSHLSYMNEIAGGPQRGWQKLSDSNFDWGQDLPALGAWLREHRVTDPVTLLYFGTAEPRAWGIRFINPPGGYFLAPVTPVSQSPGRKIVAVSASIAALPPSAPSSRLAHEILRPGRATPAGIAGRTIFLYELR